MVSLFRTVKAGSTGSVYGVSVTAPGLVWPQAQPGDNLDYTLDMTDLLQDSADAIATVVFSIAPSGIGELQALALTINDATLITAQLAGGVPGRTYLTKFDVLTVGGLTFELLVGLSISCVLAVPLVMPPPPSVGFGAPWLATGPTSAPVVTPGGGGSTGGAGVLPIASDRVVTTIAGADLIGISQGGVDVAITAANFIASLFGTTPPVSVPPVAAGSFLLEDGSGALLLEDGAGYLTQEQ